MISKEYIGNFFKKNLPLFLILLPALFLRIYKIPKTFQFEYDQEHPANAAYNFFVNHQVTLVGQELSFKGFFLGPLHDLIQFIPYKLCNLAPDCVPYFYSAIGALTIVPLYFALKKIFDHKTAVISSIIYAFSFSALSYEWGVNSNFFLFLSSIGILYLLYQYFQGGNLYLVIGAFIGGITTVNFNPVFIFTVAAYFLFALLRGNKNILVFVVSLFVFIANYIPLFIFNARHEGILTETIKNFFNQNTATNDIVPKALFLTKDIIAAYFSSYLFQSANIIFIILIVVLLVTVISRISFQKDKFALFLPFWIGAVLIGFLFYKGHIPEYYFLQILLPFIILISYSLKRNLIAAILFCVVFLSINVARIITIDYSTNYQLKKAAVQYILNDTKSGSYNIYYDFPPGLNTGYKYLFQIADNKPQEDGKNLYIIVFKDPNEINREFYASKFLQKTIEYKNFGFINVVAIQNVN